MNNTKRQRETSEDRLPTRELDSMKVKEQMTGPKIMENQDFESIAPTAASDTYYFELIPDLEKLKQDMYRVLTKKTPEKCDKSDTSSDLTSISDSSEIEMQEAQIIGKIDDLKSYNELDGEILAINAFLTKNAIFRKI